MSVDNITKCLAGDKAWFNNQGQVLDALRKAVEALETLEAVKTGGLFGERLVAREALASIRETLGIER